MCGCGRTGQAAPANPDTGIDIVVEERETGGFCAIQCKFYEPDHYVQKSDIDSFFTASGKAPFSSRIIISTTDKWGRHGDGVIVPADGSRGFQLRFALSALLEDWLLGDGAAGLRAR